MPPSQRDRVDALRQELMAELTNYEHRLCELRGRMTFLRKADEKLRAASRGKLSEFRNDVTWWTLQDVHDMLVIRLASFARGLNDTGGLFPLMRGRWIAVFKTSPRLETSPEWLRREIKATSRQIVVDRFPAAAERGRIAGDHLDACIKSVTALLDPVVDDRDANRAHPYEHKNSGTSRVLGTDEIGAAIEIIQDLLKDVRFLADASSYHYPDSIFLAQPGGTAEELVDQVLLGTRIQRELLEQRLGVEGYAWQRRERVYEILHERHDALPNPEAQCWNSDELIIGRDDE